MLKTLKRFLKKILLIQRKVFLEVAREANEEQRKVFNTMFEEEKEGGAEATPKTEE